MRSTIRAGLFALWLVLGGCGESNDPATPLSAPTPAIPAPEGGDWSRIAAETPEGGVRVGNPDASVRLVEYASLTCPHCAKFAREATGPLKELVRSGHLSWEFRHYLIFPTDPPAALLTQCVGPDAFFGLIERLYADQSVWTRKLESIPSSQMQQIRALPLRQQAGAMVKSAGLDQLLRDQGPPQSRIDSCLSDESEVAALEVLTRRGKSEGVPGTPTFFINEMIVPRKRGVSGWRALWPGLGTALAAGQSKSPRRHGEH